MSETVGDFYDALGPGGVTYLSYGGATFRIERPSEPTCSDPAGHETLYEKREQTARLNAEQRAAETTPGTCSWCGFAVGGAS